MSSITLSNLSVGYQQARRTPTAVLVGLNATLCSGRLTCLVGANGIGKSTLLRTLAAFQPPIAGQMHYYSGEQAAPINLAITGLRHRLVQTLSDGERQKMMIAKALAQDTPVILLDEPTAFLDYKSKVDVLGLLARLAHETNKMVLLSTHDLEQAVHAADALWVVAKQQLGDSALLSDQSDSSDRSDKSDRSDSFDKPNASAQCPHLPRLYVLEKHIHTTEQGHQLMFQPSPGTPAPPHLTLIATPDFEKRTQELLRLLGEEVKG